MPELPEVETIRQDLAAVVVDKPIERVRVTLPKIVQPAPASFTRSLRGKQFASIQRRGKLLLFSLRDSDRALLVHLKMTGQLIYVAGDEVIAGGHSLSPQPTSGPTAYGGALPNKYTHVAMTFTDGCQLYFNDLRQFGYMRLVDAAGRAAAEAQFGVEPLSNDFTVEYLRDVLRGRSTSLKAVLLDQSRIAGLGNIYVDEAAFYAGVRPTRRAGRVTKAEAVKLHRGIRHVLQQALKHRGTTFNSFTDGWFRPRWKLCEQA